MGRSGWHDRPRRARDTRAARRAALLSVIVIAHNQSHLTRRCLTALTRVRLPLEIVFVDNASHDDTPGLAGAFARRFRRWQGVRNRRNETFAVACNRAAARASGDTLLFLNNDVIVSPGAPGRLAAEVSRHDGGVAGARLLFPGTGTVQHAGIRQMLWGYASNFGTAAPAAHPAVNTGGAVFAVTGAMLAVGRRRFAGVGGFDARYRWGYEDVDLCLKIRRSGGAVRYRPDAVALHVESATLAARREPADLSWNYALYRRRWNHALVPLEQRAVAQLRRSGVRRVLIYGHGQAARGLCRMLTRCGLRVIGHVSPMPGVARCCGREAIGPDEAREADVDRVVAGTQHYFAIRPQVDALDPTGEAVFPLVG